MKTLSVAVDHDRHGHLTAASHERARAAAAKAGVSAGLLYAADQGRTMRVVAVRAESRGGYPPPRTSRPVAEVRNNATGRRGTIYVDRIAHLLSKGGAR